MSALRSLMYTAPVIPVITIERLEDALPLARALTGGGLTVLEITLRTPVALEAIQLIQEALPSAITGAGTVLDPEQMQACVAAGARFMVSPGFTLRLLDAARDCPIPLLPGVNSPSEVMTLLDRGMHEMKFFPAEAAGGIPMLKSIGAPLAQALFCPTGGITPALAPHYLSLPNVACVGGSWMVSKALIDAGNWPEITRLAREASQLTRH